jgi:adenine-specific DNA-methyltransferase
MKDDGVIFVSIDDNEIHNLIHLQNDIFGSENFIINIIWKARDSISNDAIISRNHNYLTCYIKDIAKLKIGLNAFRLPAEGNGYSNPDNDPRGPWKSVHIEISGVHISEGLIYEIKDSLGRTYIPKKGACWRFKKEIFEKYLEEGRIIFDPLGKTKPRYKQYLYETLKTLSSLWLDYETTTHGTRELKSMFNEIFFKNPKPVELLKTICNLTSFKSDIILDFFAGSGTTAHAVMKLNKEDGGKRKFILVEVSDYFDTVIISRIKKVAYSFNWEKGKPQDTDVIGVLF